MVPVKNTLLITFCLFLLLTSSLKSDPNSLAFSDLKAQTESFIESGDFPTALPYLKEMIKRTEALGDANKRKPLEPLFYFVALGHMMRHSQTTQPSELREALKYFGFYEKEFKSEQRYVNVLSSRADCYRVLGDFKNAILPLKELINKRNRPYRYSEEVYQATLEKIVEAYYILQDWDNGESWFRKLLNETQKEEEKGRAASALVELYLKKNQVDKTIALLPTLLKESPSRYSLGLNVALLKAGNQMRASGKYNQASLFFSLTLTPDEMIAYNEKRIRSLKSKLSFFKRKKRQEMIEELELDIFNTQQLMESLRKVESYGPDLDILKARVYFDTGRIWEAYYSHNKIINDYKDHENIEEFIFATIHGANQIGKPELAMDIGREYLANPSYQAFRKDVAMMMMQVYQDQGDYDRFFELGNEFVEQFSENQDGGVVIYLMGNTWLQLNEIDTLISKFKQFINSYPKAPWLDGCYYWVGLASIYQGNFNRAKEFFGPLVDKYPFSTYNEDGLYRYAVSIYGSGDVDGGEEAFKNFIDKYNTGSLRGECEYFLGQIYGSRGEIDKAVEHYSEVSLYADSEDYIKNSFFERGKLFFKNKMYQEMAGVYKDFLDQYPESPSFTDAIYEMGRAKELMGKPGEMQKDYMEGIINYGNYPDSKGVDKLLDVFVSKYYTTRNHLEKTIQFLEKCLKDTTFCERFIKDKGYLYEYFVENSFIDRKVEQRFRNDKAFESMETIIDPLKSTLKSYKTQYAVFPKTTPEDLFQPAFKKANNSGQFTLAFRLQMALEERGIFVNKSKVFSEDDFQFASPKLLVWIASKLKSSDPELAKNANSKVIDEFPESSYVLDALISMGELAQKNKNYNSAMNYYEKASLQFYDNEQVPLLVIKMGDIMREQGQFENAREKYQSILKTPSWRTGTLQAQALYHLGLSYFDEQKYNEAHGFFERVFVGHAYFADWAIQAYMMDARTLTKMGNNADAKKTLKECLAKDSYKENPYFLEAQELNNTL